MSEKLIVLALSTIFIVEHFADEVYSLTEEKNM